jgi:hypothetical protein
MDFVVFMGVERLIRMLGVSGPSIYNYGLSGAALGDEF